MISVARAFTSKTTTKATQYLMSPGHWDEDNVWVKSAVASIKTIRLTPLPAGDKSDSTFGEALQARPELEREPAHMKFLSKVVMPINSIIDFNGVAYKVIRFGDYTRAGFNSVIGIKLFNLEVTPHGISYSFNDAAGNKVEESFSRR